MTKVVKAPAGPLIGEVELDLVHLGIPFSKAGYHFADAVQRAEVDRRVADIGRLYPGFGVLDRDGAPLLTAKQAREFAKQYDDEEFRRALREYAGILEWCLGDLTPKISEGRLVVCREVEPGAAWTWVTAAAYNGPHADKDLMARGLVFDVITVMTCLDRQSVGKNAPTDQQVADWLRSYFQRAHDEGRPPPKQKQDAFPACRDAIKATENQMRVAIKSVADELKNGRGRPRRGDSR